MFETGQILVGVGVGVIGLLRILRWLDVFLNGADAKWTKSPMDLLYRVLEFVAFTHVAVGLILALNTYRSWAHEDDIIAIIAVTFMLAWAAAPGIGENSYTSMKTEDSCCVKFIQFLAPLLSLICCLGAFVMLGFIGARGKTTGDRTMVWTGVGLVGAFGPLPQFALNTFNLKDENAMVRGGLALLECTGWALFATGALTHELDLETPVGFPIH